MNSLELSSTKCCKNQSKYLITYSCGFEPDQKLYVCEFHYQKEFFQKHIKSLEILEKTE